MATLATSACVSSCPFRRQLQAQNLKDSDEILPSRACVLASLDSRDRVPRHAAGFSQRANRQSLLLAESTNRLADVFHVISSRQDSIRYSIHAAKLFSENRQIFSTRSCICVSENV